MKHIVWHACNYKDLMTLKMPEMSGNFPQKYLHTTLPLPRFQNVHNSHRIYLAQ